MLVMLVMLVMVLMVLMVMIYDAACDRDYCHYYPDTDSDCYADGSGCGVAVVTTMERNSLLKMHRCQYNN